jgi:hypothetical protein
MGGRWRVVLRAIALVAMAIGALAAIRLAFAPLGTADTPDLQPRYFKLADVAYQIMLPRSAKLELAPGDRILVRPHAPATRPLRVMSLAPAPGEGEPAYSRSLTLASGAALAHDVKDGAGRRSGAPIAELAGRLRMGVRALAVSCRDQGDGPLEPDWCLPYLHHLKFLARDAADPAGLQRVEFTLADVRYRILVPQGSPVTLPTDRFPSVEIRYPRLVRTVRLFRLEAASGESQATLAHSMTLSSGAVLRYTIDRSLGGGSSGPEAELTGRLDLGARVVAVMCHDQDDGGRPNPEWCVPYLHHLAIDDGR